MLTSCDRNDGEHVKRSPVLINIGYFYMYFVSTAQYDRIEERAEGDGLPMQLWNHRDGIHCAEAPCILCSGDM